MKAFWKNGEISRYTYLCFGKLFITRYGDALSDYHWHFGDVEFEQCEWYMRIHR